MLNASLKGPSKPGADRIGKRGLDLPIMESLRLPAMNTSNVLSTVDLGVGGMTCASCVARVERALAKVPGVQQAAVNLATESARVTVAGGADDLGPQLRRAVRDAGYEPRAANAAIDAASASPWAGFAPVGLGLALSAPLVLPMPTTFSARSTVGTLITHSRERRIISKL